MHCNVILVREYQVDVLLSIQAEYQMVADHISDAKPNSQIKGEAIYSEDLLKHIVISTDKTKVIRCSSYWKNGKQDVQN